MIMARTVPSRALWSSSTPATGSARSTAPSPSTRRSASRSCGGCRSATRRSTSSWACPATAPRLELTYNHGVDSYELGTGYNHIAITVDDLDATLARARRAGHRAREAAVPRARGRLADLLRARSGRLPDRADREALIDAETRLAVIDLGSNSFRLVVFTDARRLVEAHRRDLRGRAHRRGPRRDRRARRGRADGARAARRSRSSRTSAAPAGIDATMSRRSRRRAIRDATNQAEFLERGARALAGSTSRCSRARRRRATATSRRSTRRRWPTASCSTSAAARCSSSRVDGRAARPTLARGRSAPCA